MPLVTRPFLLSLLVVLQLFPDVLATTQPRGEGHRDSLPPEYWTIKEVASPHHTSRLRQLARADPSLHHSVTFAVLQKNLDTLTQLLHNVSDPRHPQYGRHWTRAQIGALTANPEASAKTLAYLLNSTRLQGRVEIVRRSLFDEYIVARAPVTVWEEALNTQFFEFDQLSTSPASRKHRNVAALEYSLPTYLADHILGVFDVLPFKKESSALRLLHPMDPNVFMDRVAATAEVGGLVQPEEKSNNYDGAVTPSVINSVYSVFSNKGNGMASQAVYESLGQSASAQDLTDFQTYFGLPLQSISNDIGNHFTQTDSGNGCPDNCAEASLDVQYIMAVAQDIPTTFYYSESSVTLSSWLSSVASMPNPPNVFSVSYGSEETEEQTSVLSAFETEAQKLGAMGVTIVVASGDDGAPGVLVEQGQANCNYYPQFPATCPYVTAVGGTVGPESGQPEVVCQSNNNCGITSGGGFSTYYKQPLWQRSVVSSYFHKETPASGYGSGRGYPDLAALANNYMVLIGGDFFSIAGTSASTPVVAGMISLVNAARLAHGGPTMGWINPFLYQYYENFTHDITSGDNLCTSDPQICCPQGFYATEGWDPVTGLGSLNFTAFYLSALRPFNYTPFITPNSAICLSPSGILVILLILLLVW